MPVGDQPDQIRPAGRVFRMPRSEAGTDVRRATAEIGEAWVSESAEGPAFNFDLTRSGERSVYGDIAVTRPGLAEPLLVARGIAVYPEVGARKVSLRVPPELAAKLKGPVHIRYSEDREIGGGTIDEADRVVK